MFKYDENVEQRYGIKLISDVVVRKEANFSQRSNFNWIRKLCLHLIANPDPMVVPIYSFEVLEEKPESDKSPWGTYRYAYEMMRLPMLDRDEKSLITTLIGHYHPVTRDNPKPEIQKGWRELPKLVEFMNVVLGQGNYTDLHNNNFLKDQEGNYRIIDLEGFRKYPGVGEPKDY